MHLNTLTNPNKNLQEKMRYFSDYFLFTNDFLGRLPFLPYDNPQSLVSKIIFQIENNIERSPRYIENHFKQLKHFFEPFLIKQISEYRNVQSDYASYNQSPATEKQRVKWLKSHPEFLDHLKDLHSQLEDKLFQTIFLWLSNYMVCKHQLKHHKKVIEFCTQILVSLFRLNGHTHKSVSEYIDRILSSDRTNFPFPLEFYEHSSSEKFIQLTDEFFANRDFKRQFEGLKNLMLNPTKRRGYFIYAIDKVKIDKPINKDFKISYDQVTFISPNHLQLKLLRKELREKDKESKHMKFFPTFFSRHKLLAYVNLNYEDKKSAAKKGWILVKEELKHLSQYLEKEISIKRQSFLFTPDFQNNGWYASINFSHVITWVDSFNFKRMQQNPFEKLRQISPPAKNQLLHNERVFIKAVAEDESSLYWQYIENLFWYQNQDNHSIRFSFLKLVMDDVQLYQNDLLLHFGHSFYTLPFGKSIPDIGLSEEELKLFSSRLGYQQDTKFPLRKYKSKIKHPFLKTVLNYVLEIKSKKYRDNWESHFASIILELQEYRNSEVHSGFLNNYSKIKLTDVLPLIMNRARWYIVDSCLKNKSLSFDQIMEKLIK